MSARVVAIANRKGGVGKTTTTVNMAAVLGQAGKRVLVVDLDPQTNATRSCTRGFTPSESVYTIFDKPDHVQHAIVHTKHKFDILLGDNNLVTLERELQGTTDNPYRVFSETLEPLRNEYDFILLDSPPELGFLMLSGLVAADEVLIPMQAEPLATDGTTELIETVAKARVWNRDLRILGVFITMFQKVRAQIEVVDGASAYFGMDVRLFDTKIRRTVKFQEAVRHRQPAVELFPKNDLVHGYVELAKEVFGV